MFEPKVPAIGASIGFVLSFLTGLISGASFPVVILRAVLMAVLFGGLAFGGKFLILKFIPDLFSSGSVEAGLSERNAVDITVGSTDRDENPFSMSNIQNQEEMVPDFARNQDVSQSGSVNSHDVPVTETGFQADPFLTAAPARASLASSSKGVSDAEMAGGLDVLPDLADFMPQVSESDAEPENDMVAPHSGGGMHDSMFDTSEVKGSSVETETMTKAIRTILSRDS